MAKKKKNDKHIKPLKTDYKGDEKGKLSNAKVAIREEMRAILDAAKKQNLIQFTASKVRKARNFTTEDILSFISDVKVKTTQEVKKVVLGPNKSTDKPVASPPQETIQKEDAPATGDNSMAYYDRWYSLVSDRGGRKDSTIKEPPYDK